MNWLRYVLLAVCILSALAGYRKGLVRTVLSMVFLILVTGLAIWMNPYVTDVLNERTTLPQYVEKKCLETFENNEFLSGENQDVQKKWLESMGVPEELDLVSCVRCCGSGFSLRWCTAFRRHTGGMYA